MTKNKNRFERFVDVHNKLKLKRHNQGDKYYSDYDTYLGFSFIMVIVGFMFINSTTGILFITLTLTFLVLNNVEITPIEKVRKKPIKPNLKDQNEQKIINK